MKELKAKQKIINYLKKGNISKICFNSSSYNYKENSFEFEVEISKNYVYKIDNKGNIREEEVKK